MLSFDLAKQELRQFESNAHVVHAGFRKKMVSGEEQWEITIDKLMLYQFQSKEPEKYAFEAEIKPDYDLHTSVLKGVLENDFPGINNLTVSVKPQFKVLPIPFFNIPIKIPFTDIGWRKAPNKVRGDDSLGTVPVEVKMTFTPTDNMNGGGLWNSLNKLACLHTKNTRDLNGNVEVISTTTSKRASMNPLRSYPYGYPLAKQVLDPPVINSGFGAQTANVALIGGPMLAIGSCYVAALCAMAKEGHKSSASSTGFTLGLLTGSSHSSGIDTIAGMALAGSPCGFASGYGNGLLFNQTLISGATLASSAAEAASSPTCHAPFATRTKIINKR